MKRPSLPSLCHGLLLAGIAASMLAIVWVPPSFLDWLAERYGTVWFGLYFNVQPFFPSWLQYFAVQTVAALLAVLGAACWLLGRKPLRLPALDRRLLFPGLVAAYAAWAALTWLWSAWPYATLASVMRELPFYFMCLAAMVLCRRQERWVAVARVFLVAAAAEAFLQAVIIVATALARDVTLGRAFLDEAVFYGNPNFGCAILLTGAFIAVGFALAEFRRPGPKRGAERERVRARVVVGAALALAVLGFVFFVAGSLAGYVAGAVGLIAYVLSVATLKRKRWVTVGLLLAVAVGMLTMVASDRLWRKSLRALLSPRRTTHLRVVDWLAATELYVRRPVHGWGMGTFPATHARFHPRLARKLPFTSTTRTTHPHNEFVRVAADQGAVGLLLYLGILAYAFTVSYRALAKAAPRLRLIGYALWAGALTFVVQGAFGKAPMNWSFAANFWLLLGVLASAPGWSRTPPPAEGEGTEPGAPPETRARTGPSAALRWLAVVAIAAAVGWWWWSWGLGGYTSQVRLMWARMGQEKLPKPEVAWDGFSQLQHALEQARPRCLWPDEILHMDYVTGWFLADKDRWPEAAQKLEQVQQVAPDFLRTRALLAECYLNLGRRRDAVKELDQFLASDPYDLKAYRLLQRIEPAAAVNALEQHVLGRLSQDEDWVVEDYASADEVEALLDLYVRYGLWQSARDLVSRVRAFYATAEVRRPVDASAQVRRLARKYRQTGKEALADQLRQAFPEAWPPAAPNAAP